MFDLLTGWAVAKGLGKTLAEVEKTRFQQHVRDAYLEWCNTIPSRVVVDENVTTSMAFLEQRDNPPTAQLLHTISTGNIPNQYQWEQYFTALWHSVKLISKSNDESFFMLPESEALPCLQDLSTRIYQVCLQDDSLLSQHSDDQLDVINQLIAHQFSIDDFQAQRQAVQHRINAELNTSTALDKASLYQAQQTLQDQFSSLEICYKEKLLQLSHTHEALSQLQTLFKHDEYESAQAALMTGDSSASNLLFQHVITTSDSSDVQKAVAHYQLAILARDELDYDRARHHFEAAVQRQPGNPLYHTTCGILQHELNHFSLAIDSFRNALSLYESRPDTEHSVAFLNDRLGQSLARCGQWDGAVECYQAALAIDIVQAGEYQTSVAAIYHHLAQAWAGKQDFDQAIHYYDKAIKIDQFIHGPRHRAIASELIDMGHAFDGKQLYPKAIASYDKALDILTNILPYQHPDIALLMDFLAQTWARQGTPSKALFFYKKALNIQRQLYGDAHLDTFTTLQHIAELYLKQSDYDNAVEYNKQTIDAGIALFGANSPRLIPAYMNLASTWINKGENDQGIAVCETALDITLNYFGENHEHYGKLWSYIGYAYSSKADYHIAVQSYEKSLAILREVLGSQHPYTTSVVDALILARKHQAQSVLM